MVGDILEATGEAMPNDDERREVASRIRMGSPDWVGNHYEKWLGPKFGMTVLSGGGRDEIDDAARLLADFIEPEPELTCHLVQMPWNGAPPYRRSNVVLDAMTDGCSECGYPIMARFRKVPNYCPNCGSKVVNDGC